MKWFVAKKKLDDDVKVFIILAKINFDKKLLAWPYAMKISIKKFIATITKLPILNKAKETLALRAARFFLTLKEPGGGGGICPRQL